MARPDELTFAPLGGVGEIGMNLSIYGLGNRHQRTWLAVDLGVSFGDEEHLPGIDLIMPDIRFLEKERKNLMGLVLTHAHEDHFGAIIDLWPKLKCPIYATQVQRRAVRGQMRGRAQSAEDPGHGGAVGRRASISARSTSNSFRSRIRFRNRTRWRSTPRSAPCCTPATGRSIRRRSSACRPTSGGCANSATRACWRWSAIPPTRCARALAVGDRGRRDHHRSWSRPPRAASRSRPSPPTSRA